MTWRLANSLMVLRDQFNALSPNRNRSSDGTIGDAAHASRSSDHNPWVKHGKTGVVTALDITHDPSKGIDTWSIAEYLRTKRDARIKYVISNKRIFSSVQSPWEWRRYTGSNPHSSHMHVSVHSSRSLYDNETKWELAVFGTMPPPDPDSPAVRPILKVGSTGEYVLEVQTVLGMERLDAVFGPATEAAVKTFQKSHRLKVDGVVGPATWAALDRIEQRRDGEHEGDLFEG